VSEDLQAVYILLLGTFLGVVKHFPLIDLALLDIGIIIFYFTVWLLAA
jgi:hypothetical protein